MTPIPDSVLTAESFADALHATIAHYAADSGTIHMLAADGLLHLRAASAGIPQVVLDRVQTIPVGKGMAGLAVERVEPITICNIQTDTSGDVRPGAKLTGMEGAIVVPMLRDDECVGAFGIANRAERTFTSEETDLLLRIAAHVAAQHG